MVTILELQSTDKSAILSVINDAARAYKGVILQDRWKDPYMSAEEFDKDLKDGVQFYGLTKEGALMGVAGIQHYGDVDLIRHCYVRTDAQRRVVGAPSSGICLHSSAPPKFWSGRGKTQNGRFVFTSSTGLSKFHAKKRTDSSRDTGISLEDKSRHPSCLDIENQPH